MVSTNEGGSRLVSPAEVQIPAHRAGVMSQEPLLDARDIVKRFRRRDGSTLSAVDGVSLSINAAETVALVGETGSGKSTLARVALGLTASDEGEIRYKGKRLDEMPPAERHLFRLAVQPIFQDTAASFNPRRRVRQLMQQALEQAGTSRVKIVDATEAALTSVGLLVTADFLQRFPHELSGGQRQRLAIARALSMAPDLIIADEPLSGADASIRGQILNLLDDLQHERRLAYLLITHDISIARAFAHRVAVMYQGTVVEEGLAEQVLRHPRHPYTQLLLAAAPSIAGQVDLSSFTTVAQRDPSPGGCVFYSRCPLAIEACTKARPELRRVGPDGHRAACIAVEASSDERASPAVNENQPVN